MVLKIIIRNCYKLLNKRLLAAWLIFAFLILGVVVLVIEINKRHDAFFFLVFWNRVCKADLDLTM